MPLITEKELQDLKSTDTVVIWGCGYSINDLNENDIKELSRFNSVAFNWFCFSKIPTTYYLVREQANLKKRTHGNENLDNFYNNMNCDYKDSCLVVHDLKEHSPHAYDYTLKDNLKQFDSNYVVVRDKKLKSNDPGVKYWKDESIFKSGLYHGKCSLTNALHLAMYLKYNRIIFAGVDLYDSRYFWLKNNETRYSVANKNKDMNTRHSTAGAAISLVKDVKKYYIGTELYTYNPKSLLKGAIPIWER